MTSSSGISLRRRGLLLLVFVLSGATGLVYEIAWMRRLTHVFGSTTLAVSTVLAAFMGGLALGSFLFGHRADRRPDQGLRLYGYFEIGIGLFAVAVPLFFRGIEAVYLALAPAFEKLPALFLIVQLLLAILVLGPPTILMGGTLPLLSRFLVRRREEIGGLVGALYAANTIGAAAGAYAATYFLLPGIGVWRSEIVAAVVNVAIGVAALAMQKTWTATAAPEGVSPDQAPEPTPEERDLEEIPPEEKRRGRARRARRMAERAAAATVVPTPSAAAEVSSIGPLLAGIALSGFAAMVYEVAWSRILAMILGSSVYAFGMMLLVFLVGLSLGSALFTRLARRVGAVPLFLGVLASNAVAGLVSMALIPSLPGLFLRLFPAVQGSFVLLQLLQFFVASVLLLPPALFFGMAFPAAIAATTASEGGVGRGVGRVNAANTAGTVLGAFLGGFVLIPRLGLRATLMTALTASAVATLVVLWKGTAGVQGWRRPASLAAGVLLVVLALTPAWPREVLASGAGFFAKQYESPQQFFDGVRQMKLLFYKDGINTTLSVDEIDGHRYYRSNGKTDASTVPSDLAVQVLLGQLPMLLHPDPKEVFDLGLGTGASAAAIARYPGVEQIDIVDIEPAGQMAVRFFDSVNRNILAEPRVRYTPTDGRNFLLARKKKYDVIICDPSDVWVAGVANLFTREYYELAKSRLKPGGVFVQWWHTHALHPDEMKLIVATLHRVFPHASYWRPNFGDVIMVGTVDPLPWDYARIQQRWNVPGVAEDMRMIGLWHPLSLFAAFVLEGDDLDRLVAGVTEDHHDDRPVVEYRAPKFLYVDTASANDAMITGNQTRPFPASLINLDPSRDLDARALYLLGFGYASLNRFALAIPRMEEAVALEPGNAKFWIGLGNQYAGQAQPARAIEAYRRALAADPADVEAAAALVQALRGQGDEPAAQEALRQALEKNPGSPELRQLAGGAGTP
jgi:spermidine synthase